MKYVPVSVIIPCYNSYNTIERAICSVINQSWLPKELILVDDCSSDHEKTLQKLYTLKNKYNKFLDIKVIALPINSGAASARNAGWNAASQSYIALLDSDDAWHPQKIEIQYNWMLNNPKAVLSGHGYKIITNEGDNNVSKDINDKGVVKQIGKQRILIKNHFVTCSVMMKRDLNLRFLEGKRYVDDHLLWMEIVFNGNYIYYIDQPLAHIYKSTYGQSGLSSHMQQMQEGEIEAYELLFKDFKLNPILLRIIKCYSYTKYFRRLIVQYIRRRKGLGKLWI